eukprot:8448973-Lingulodinium_polyedra.AAC.1
MDSPRFNAEGWAFVKGHRSQAQWVKELLPAAAGKDADGKWFLMKEGNAVFINTLKMEFMDLYPTLSMDPEEAQSSFTVHRFQQSHSGQYMFWDLRSIQDASGCNQSFPL